MSVQYPPSEGDLMNIPDATAFLGYKWVGNLRALCQKNKIAHFKVTIPGNITPGFLIKKSVLEQFKEREMPKRKAHAEKLGGKGTKTGAAFAALEARVTEIEKQLGINQQKEEAA